MSFDESSDTLNVEGYSIRTSLAAREIITVKVTYSADALKEETLLQVQNFLTVRDSGSCQVNGYCTCAEGGIATASETDYRVIKRVNDHLIKVIFR